MGLFSKKKIEGDELLSYLDYIGEEWKLKTFQQKEAELYTQALETYNPQSSKDVEALVQLLGAANRLAQSAAELMRRKDAITSVPDKATSLFFAWHAAYNDYLAWAAAQADAIAAKAANEVADMTKVKELQTKSEDSRAEAEDEEQKLMKNFKLTDADIDQLLDRAEQFVQQDKWRPRTVTYKPKSRMSGR
ncbi:hypothetical protein DGWBC_0789 [Dehalogenimonas sp. WBC-2]|nr:hypothetical protein DGWBC_0789 [Dehalogenimonas sp. WBC-2]